MGEINESASRPAAKSSEFVASNLKSNLPIVNGRWNSWIDFLTTKERYIVVRYCQMRYIIPFSSKEFSEETTFID